jgi:LCP family protein required for cell wall assembly
MASISTKKRVITVTAVIGLLLIGVTAAFAYSTWGDVNRVSIERVSPVDVAPQPGDGENEEEPREPATLKNEIYLLVGSDSRAHLDDLDGFGAFEGRRADVVMVLITTPTGSALLSLPRDLWVAEHCIGEESRLNVLLEGCPERMNGPTLLVMAVEELIGMPVDHYAMVDLAGFQQVVDRIGGYEVCVDNPVRDDLANLELPAGCTDATGAQTLAWLRSRHTEELTEDGWRMVAGINDLVRNQRQRDFLIEMMGRLADFTSPQSLTSMAMALAPHITVDDTLTIGDAVNLAWIMRDLGSGDITELEIPVIDHITEDGAAVLVPVTPVDETVASFIDGRTTADAPGVAAFSVKG